MTTPFTVDRPLKTIRFSDGSTILVRPIGIRDGRLLSNFLAQLSTETGYRRFLSSVGSVRSRWVAATINADQVDSLVLGAYADDGFGPVLVAVAESIRDQDDPELAEFALVAADPWQNKGIGTLLARHLADLARETGVRRWVSYMLAENHQMARVLNRVGRRVAGEIDSGLTRMIYELKPTPARRA